MLRPPPASSSPQSESESASSVEEESEDDAHLLMPLVPQVTNPATMIKQPATSSEAMTATTRSSQTGKTPITINLPPKLVRQAEEGRKKQE